MLIGLGEEKNPIDFRFTRSKVKVTMVLFVKQWFPLIFLRTFYHRAIILTDFYTQKGTSVVVCYGARHLTDSSPICPSDVAKSCPLINFKLISPR